MSVFNKCSKLPPETTGGFLFPPGAIPPPGSHPPGVRSGSYSGGVGVAPTRAHIPAPSGSIPGSASRYPGSSGAERASPMAPASCGAFGTASDMQPSISVCR